MGVSNLHTDWRDLVLKAMPIDKRGSIWLDWNYTAIAPVRSLNADYELFANSLVFNNKFSIQQLTLKEYLNDLFDPILRGISITTDNNVNNYTGFTINVPDYLTYGNYEEIFTAALGRYLYLGVKFDFAVYVYSGAAPEFVAYLDELTSNLAADEYISDAEIWAVIYVWNQLQPNGILADITRLHLISRTNRVNGRVDFITPAGAKLTEVLGAGDLIFDWTGFSSDGVAYLSSPDNLSVLVADVDNYCSILHISRDGGVDAGVDSGVSQGVNTSKIINRLTTSTARSIRGQSDNVDYGTTGNSSVGGVLQYTDTSEHNIIKDGVVEGVDVTINAASATPTLPPFILCENDDSVAVNFSSNTVCTWGEVNSALTPANRLLLNNVLNEYNRRMGRF